MLNSRTLVRDAALQGVGLFTASPARLTIRPSGEGAGIVFRRMDLPGGPAIPARIGRVIPPGVGPLAKLPGRNTSLASEDGRAFVLTVEHVLSALVGMGVGDAILELEGPEVPMFDGSALAFVEAILGASTPSEPGSAPERSISAGMVTDGAGGASVVLEGSDGGPSQYEYALDYSGMPGVASGVVAPGSALAASSVSWKLGDSETYRRMIAPARTFCLAIEATAMRAAGLFRHLTPSDMLVIGDDGQPIENALRFPDEAARHKLLDLIGDMALAGAFRGRVRGVRSGHALHHRAAGEVARQMLFQDG